MNFQQEFFMLYVLVDDIAYFLVILSKIDKSKFHR